MYFGPTDYETLKDYNLNLENSVPMAGNFGWLNRFIFSIIFIFNKLFSYGISIMTIIVKVAISPHIQIIFIPDKNENFKT